MVKLFITGGLGSGKSTHAKRLSKKLAIPFYELDTLYWDHSNPQEHDVKRDPACRNKMLSEILKSDDWICEGTYMEEWINPIIEQADKIIYLDVSLWKRQVRLILRHIKRRLGIETIPYRETLPLLVTLLKYNIYCEHHVLPTLKEKIKR